MAGNRSADKPPFEKQAANPQAESPLFNAAMPRDVREQGVYAYAFESTPASASIKALGMFARVSQRAEAESAFRRLLHAAVGAEPESYQQADETRLAAVAILIRHPELLFRDDRITDHFGRKIVASPYRLLLGSGDVWALKQVHEEIIAKIQDETIRAATQAKAQDQFQQQFPDPFCALALFTNEDLTALKSLKTENEDLQAKIQLLDGQNEEYKRVLFAKSEFAVLHQLLLESEHENLCVKLFTEDMCYDERNRVQIARIRASLKKVVAAITDDPCMPCVNGFTTRPETKTAVTELCQLFQPEVGEVIRTGLHFPQAILQDIYREYDAADWNDYGLDLKYSYFSCTVIEAALEASTVVDGQCYKHGLYKLSSSTLFAQKGPDRRDGLFCLHPRGVPPELAPGGSRAGRMMFVDPYNGESSFLSPMAPGAFVCYKENGQARGGTRVYVSPRGRLPLDLLCRTKAETYGNYYMATSRQVNTLPRPK